LGLKLIALEKRLEEMDKKYLDLLNTTKQTTKESKVKDHGSTESDVWTLLTLRSPPQECELKQNTYRDQRTLQSPR
jgi:hypothetical protein